MQRSKIPHLVLHLREFSIFVRVHAFGRRYTVSPRHGFQPNLSGVRHPSAVLRVTPTGKKRAFPSKVAASIKTRFGTPPEYHSTHRSAPEVARLHSEKKPAAIFR